MEDNGGLKHLIGLIADLNGELKIQESYCDSINMNTSDLVEKWIDFS